MATTKSSRDKAKAQQAQATAQQAAAPMPKIRSLPGQVYQLTHADLTEVRLRQQALMMAKAMFLLSQTGYEQYVIGVMGKYGIDAETTDIGNKWTINLNTGEIVSASGGGPRVTASMMEAQNSGAATTTPYVPPEDE